MARIKILPIVILFVTISILLFTVDLLHREIGFLSLYSLDEFAFHGSLLTILDGIVTVNPVQIFNFSFLNYGFGFFLSNLIVTFPFLLSGDIGNSILMPRLVTSLFALGGLAVIYFFSRKYVDEWISFLLVLFAVTMPAFWTNATWFHPDWLMTTFLMVAFYFFEKNDANNGKDYWRGIFFFALSLGVAKFQAIVFFPFLVFYLFKEEITHFRFSSVHVRVKYFIYSSGLVLFIFIFTNPYILHPTGFREFYNMFQGNMISNKTAHGILLHYSILDKLTNAVFAYYLNPLLFVVCAGLIVYWCVDYFRNKSNGAFQSLSFYLMLYLLYLLFFVNKDWQSYYLNLFFPLIFLSIPLLAKLTKQFQFAVLSVAIISQLAYYQTDYTTLIERGHSNRPETVVDIDKHRAISQFIVSSLQAEVSPTSTILISPYTGFAFDQLNLPYTNISIIYGPIKREMIDVHSALRNSVLPLNKERLPLKYREKDFIVLRKDDVYFSKNHILQQVNHTDWQEGAKLIEELHSGGHGYRLLSENSDVIIYKLTDRSSIL